MSPTGAGPSVRAGSMAVDRTPRPRPGRTAALPLTALCLLAVGFAGLAVWEAWSDAATFDEPVYIAAGVLAISNHDLWINDEHPPLAKVLAALPALAAHPLLPKAPTRTVADEQSYSARFVQANLAAGRLHRLVFLARLIPIVETIAIALACWTLAKRVAGPWAGLLAGGLWLVSPTTLGLGHLDGIDLPFTLVTVLLAVAMDHYLRLPSSRRAVIVGAVAAGAVSVRSTGLLVVAVAVVIIVVWGAGARRERAALRDAATVVVLAWAGLWAVYLLLDPSLLVQSGVAPAPFISGLGRLSRLGSVPGWAFVLGRYHQGPWWSYWPLILIVKEPVTTVAVMLAGLVAWRRLPGDDLRRLGACCVVPGVALAAFTLSVPRPIGFRYLLPVMPLWLVAASPIVLPAARHVLPVLGSRLRRHFGATGLAVIMVAGVAFTAFSAPHSLSWTEPPLRPGWRVATNSDVDWGQGFAQLVSWSRQRRPWVAYNGPRGIGVADIPGARSLPADMRPTAGWLAVSASLITASPSGPYTWLRAVCPVGDLAGSILLYHFVAPSTGSVPAPGEDSTLVAVPGTAPPATPAGICRATHSQARGPS